MNDLSPEEKPARLPYINHARPVLLTVAVNAAAVFIFLWGKPLTFWIIMADASICGVITSFADVFAVSGSIRKLRSRGTPPKEAPRNRLIGMMPRNPLLFAIALAVAFGLLSPLFNAFIILFYGIKEFSFAPFLVYRLIYTCVLSAKITEIAVLRYAQPDCASAADITAPGAETVKDPFPRVSTLKQWYNTVTDDFGFNLLFGLLAGGTVIQGSLVIIPPVTLDGIAISALILGVIVTARLAYPVAKSMRELRENGGLPLSGTYDKRIGWIPYSPAKFALVLLLPIVAASLLVFWAVLSFFGFAVLNFFQFFFIRMLFVSLLTKPVVRLAISRYAQPAADKKE